MLLSYLVTSRARRDLLRLLWVEGFVASVSDLARRGRVSFAGAYRELESMRVEGLALSERVGAAVVYRANPRYPQSGLVRQLLKEDEAHAAPLPVSDGERVRGWLAAVGAPLPVSRPPEEPMPRLEEVLAEGLVLSHRDATVARALPVARWRQRDRWNYDRLVQAATRRNERQALGFFLYLTGRLSGSARWASLSDRLRDRRRSREQPFFAGRKGHTALALARKRTPPLALRWGYLMNMGLDRFASVFAKHTGIDNSTG